jgi:C4-dicarboxylate-specific signal transduction histidine kinase
VSQSATPCSSPEDNREPLDLKELFEQELPLLKAHDKFHDVSFATNFEQNMPKVKADKQQVQQLLCAMLDNAASALQSISNRTKTITIEICSVNQKRGVQIMISDNGVGISPANLHKVFREPFTTKPGASGLGLLSVDRIVKDHGGTIQVHSDEGAYTLFVIKLPSCEEKPVSAAQAEPAVESVN